MRWQVHKTPKGYRVRAKADNGRILFASTEAYKNRWMAVANAVLFGAPVKLNATDNEAWV